jgi:hypothetical protein
MRLGRADLAEASARCLAVGQPEPAGGGASSPEAIFADLKYLHVFTFTPLIWIQITNRDPNIYR